MSGFAGIVRTATDPNAKPSDPEIVERMAQQLAFRGPDGQNVWSRGEATFCFSLLRTGPAPQAETQPLTLDGRTWILGDVRLDGRDDVIRRLRGKGEECSVESPDEELVLRAWRSSSAQEKRELFQEFLTGDYSFVLWGPGSRQLHCFRSLMGGRPFFYSQTNGALAFGNTLEAVRLAPWVSCELDPFFVGDFLLHSWCPDQERTVYRDIKRLPPGHEVTFSSNGLQLRRAAELPIEEPLWRKHAGEYLEEFRQLVEKAVRDRLPASGAVVSLSGGLDSSTVAATSAALLRKNTTGGSLHAITVSYQPLFEDQEAEFAALTARHLGIPSEVLEVGGYGPYFGWDKQAFVPPEPVHDPFQAQTTLFFEAARKKARIVLAGDGGDDVLNSPAWPYAKYLFRRGKLGALVNAFGGYFLRHGKFPPLGAGILTRVRKLLGIQEEPPQYPGWLNPEFERACGLRERWSELEAEPKELHPLHPRGYLGLMHPFWPKMEDDQDAGCTGTVMERRTPLFDVRLLRFLLRVPPVPWCSDKELLRRAMKGILSEKIRTRAKAPLAEEPLELYLLQQGWRPSTGEPCSAVQNYVDWQKWRATPLDKPGSYLWMNLCPVSFDLWLKRIEKRSGIQ
ncbi:MAG TPA: asparagine synthase-related protein [Candidatus Acidoferrum sp.]|nr:asparagine synthase-related protein [Candidatus Acidoferrum sp.]